MHKEEIPTWRATLFSKIAAQKQPLPFEQGFLSLGSLPHLYA